MDDSRRFIEDMSPPVADRLRRYRLSARREEIGCGGFALFLLACGAGLVIATDLPAWLAAAPLAVGAWMVLGLIAGAADARTVRLVPYFRDKVPGPFTLLRGRAMLRMSGLLDRIAQVRRVTPLTAFLCDDPLAGGTPLWQDAARAVETLDALIAEMPEHQSNLPSYEDVLRDCREWRERLSNAAERGVPFYVLLRFGNSISGHEMSLRGGEF